MALPHTHDATPLLVLLQLPHARDATLGWGRVGWGGMLTFIGTSTHTHDATPLLVLLQLPHTRLATLEVLVLAKDSVPNNIPSTKGSMKVNRKIFRYVRSFQWRWENPRELLKTTAAYIKQLS